MEDPCKKPNCFVQGSSMSHRHHTKHTKQERAYREEIISSLREFDNIREWADLVRNLTRFTEIIKKNATHKMCYVPELYPVAQRLAQCLSPALPYGVHLKALETYEAIFSILGPDGTADSLPALSLGILPLFSYAAIPVKPFFLRLVRDHITPLASRTLPALAGLVPSLLAGVANEAEDSKMRMEVDQILLSFMSADPGFFFSILWKTVGAGGPARLQAISFIARQTRGRLAGDPALLVYLPADPESAVEAVTSALRSEDEMEVRELLDLVKTLFPLSKCPLEPAAVARLLAAAAGQLGRSQNVDRRIHEWLMAAPLTAWVPTMGAALFQLLAPPSRSVAAAASGEELEAPLSRVTVEMRDANAGNRDSVYLDLVPILAPLIVAYVGWTVEHNELLRPHKVAAVGKNILGFDGHLTAYSFRALAKTITLGWPVVVDGKMQRSSEVTLAWIARLLERATSVLPPAEGSLGADELIRKPSKDVLGEPVYSLPGSLPRVLGEMVVALLLAACPLALDESKLEQLAPVLEVVCSLTLTKFSGEGLTELTSMFFSKHTGEHSFLPASFPACQETTPFALLAQAAVRGGTLTSPPVLEFLRLAMELVPARYVSVAFEGEWLSTLIDACAVGQVMPIRTLLGVLSTNTPAAKRLVSLLESNLDRPTALVTALWEGLDTSSRATNAELLCQLCVIPTTSCLGDALEKQLASGLTGSDPAARIAALDGMTVLWQTAIVQYPDRPLLLGSSLLLVLEMLQRDQPENLTAALANFVQTASCLRRHAFKMLEPVLFLFQGLGVAEDAGRPKLRRRGGQIGIDLPRAAYGLSLISNLVTLSRVEILTSLKDMPVSNVAASLVPQPFPCAGERKKASDQASPSAAAAGGSDDAKDSEEEVDDRDYLSLLVDLTVSLFAVDEPDPMVRPARASAATLFCRIMRYLDTGSAPLKVRAAEISDRLAPALAKCIKATHAESPIILDAYKAILRAAVSARTDPSAFELLADSGLPTAVTELLQPGLLHLLLEKAVGLGSPAKGCMRATSSFILSAIELLAPLPVNAAEGLPLADIVKASDAIDEKGLLPTDDSGADAQRDMETKLKAKAKETLRALRTKAPEIGKRVQEHGGADSLRPVPQRFRPDMLIARALVEKAGASLFAALGRSTDYTAHDRRLLLLVPLAACCRHMARCHIAADSLFVGPELRTALASPKGVEVLKSVGQSVFQTITLGGLLTGDFLRPLLSDKAHKNSIGDSAIVAVYPLVIRALLSVSTALRDRPSSSVLDIQLKEEITGLVDLLCHRSPLHFIAQLVSVVCLPPAGASSESVILGIIEMLRGSEVVTPPLLLQQVNKLLPCVRQVNKMTSGNRSPFPQELLTGMCPNDNPLAGAQHQLRAVIAGAEESATVNMVCRLVSAQPPEHLGDAWDDAVTLIGQSGSSSNPYTQISLLGLVRELSLATPLGNASSRVEQVRRLCESVASVASWKLMDRSSSGSRSASGERPQLEEIKVMALNALGSAFEALSGWPRRIPGPQGIIAEAEFCAGSVGMPFAAAAVAAAFAVLSPGRDGFFPIGAVPEAALGVLFSVTKQPLEEAKALLNKPCTSAMSSAGFLRQPMAQLRRWMPVVSCGVCVGTRQLSVNPGMEGAEASNLIDIASSLLGSQNGPAKHQLLMRNAVFLVLSARGGKFDRDAQRVTQYMGAKVRAVDDLDPSDAIGVLRCSMLLIRALYLRCSQTALNPFWPVFASVIMRALQMGVTAEAPRLTAEAASLVEELQFIQPPGMLLTDWMFIRDSALRTDKAHTGLACVPLLALATGHNTLVSKADPPTPPLTEGVTRPLCSSMVEASVPRLEAASFRRSMMPSVLREDGPVEWSSSVHPRLGDLFVAPDDVDGEKGAASHAECLLLLEHGILRDVTR
eukprot:gnl/Dysnectes_brevis/1341_a1505_456.p1 GENE.gnl/Dysnectes_brevis/1341_a1505_456~~gnl/Dysnectes_brevis/1341_a1505_456.p1  ORF type:complete len:1898 (+),score=801.91 gnl/Dysnectes_brevis/1341_a1505_456:8-5701(+)